MTTLKTLKMRIPAMVFLHTGMVQKRKPAGLVAAAGFHVYARPMWATSLKPERHDTR